jgi:hypothetical protein
MLDGKLVMYLLTGAGNETRVLLAFVVEEASEFLVGGWYYALFVKYG